MPDSDGGNHCVAYKLLRTGKRHQRRCHTFSTSTQVTAFLLCPLAAFSSYCALAALALAPITVSRSDSTFQRTIYPVFGVRVRISVRVEVRSGGVGSGRVGFGGKT